MHCGKFTCSATGGQQGTGRRETHRKATTTAKLRKDSGLGGEGDGENIEQQLDQEGAAEGPTPTGKGGGYGG